LNGRLEVLKQLGEKFQQEYGVSLAVEVVDLGEIKKQIQLGESADLAIIPHDNLGPLVEIGSHGSAY
jgi:maltose-binding protein MalE